MSSIPAWARVGAKVVCVKVGEWSNTHPGEKHPRFGDVLTVREGIFLGGELYLRFAEIRNPPVRYAPGLGFFEGSYFIDRFRPLVARTAEQDIAEHFAHHLRRDVPARERA